MLLTLSACVQASVTPADLRWQADGSVRNLKGQVFRSSLTGVHAAFTVPDGIYLSGYRIDANGINHTAVAFVASNLSAARYWAFPQPVTQFFRFDNALLLTDITGNVMRRSDSGWVQDPLRLAPGSVLLTASRGEVIACSPAPMRMSESGEGACRSLTHGWRLPLDWVEPVPALCGDSLVAVTGLGASRQALRIGLRDGVVTGQQTLKTQLTKRLGLCELRF